MGISDLMGGSTQVDILTGPQKKLVGDMSQRMRREFGQSADVYQGAGVPGMDPLMQQAYGQAAGGGFNVDPAYRAALDPSLAGAGDPQGVRDMFQASLAPARTEFNRALQGVGEKYGNTYGRTSALPDMAGRATVEYGDRLNQLLASMTYQDRQQASNRQLQGVQTGMGLEGLEGSSIDRLYGMGENARQIQSQEAASDYSKWLSGQWYNNPALQFIAPTLGTQTSAIGTSPDLWNFLGPL
jgi:hypothetical protein